MKKTFDLAFDAVDIVKADSKDEIIALLAQRFATTYGIEEAALHERLAFREKLGSTGYGRGVAIPHVQMSSFDLPVAVFFRLEKPVDYESADGLPVDMVFGLLSPADSGAVHLQALAAVSRMLRDERMRSSIAAAPDREALFGLLTNSIDRDAA